MTARHLAAAHPMLAVFWAPVVRIIDTNVEVKLFAVLVGMANAILGDEIFLGILLSLVFVMAGDWRYGRAAAKRRKDFSEEISTWGYRTKVASFIEVLFLRLIENQVMQLPKVPEWWNYGFFSAAIACGLLISEFRSYDRNRRAMGGPPIAGVSQALTVMERVADALIPVESKDRNDTEE